MRPQDLAAPREGKTAEQTVCFATQPPKQSRGVSDALHLADELALEVENLIATDNDVPGPPARYIERLLCCKFLSDVSKRSAVRQHPLLDRLLVHARGYDIERNAGRAEHLRTTYACRGKHNHSLTFSPRSASRLRTAAAVSSIDRLDTSIAGQSCCSNILRVFATSARTASTST